VKSGLCASRFLFICACGGVHAGRRIVGRAEPKWRDCGDAREL
jgi:hypothetical protein